MKKIIQWIRNNKKETCVLLIIILISGALRFYKIDQYMFFLGDEGRDALIIKEMLVEHHIPLIGPPTSIGDMYNGPLYYYMMSVPMAIFWLNPVAAAGMVVLVGTLTVGLIYYLAREWFGKSAAVISSVLYSLSPVNIIYSHSSWNPNPAPFFALLAIIGFYHIRKYKDFRWLLLSGLAVAFAIQMHYLSLILLPIAGVLWIYELVKTKISKKDLKKFIVFTILAGILFAILMSPPVIFDFRHGFMNFHAFSKFFFGDRETTVNLNILNALGRIYPIYTHNLIERYITGENRWLVQLISALVLIPLLITLYKWVKERALSWPMLVLGVWMVGGILGLSLYKQTIYDHYLGFLNPVPFLLLGGLTQTIRSAWRIEKYLKAGMIILVLILMIVSIARSPLFSTPNNQLKRTQEISKSIIAASGNKPFNFALIAEHNYDAAYQYYLDLYGYEPKKVPFEITDQLFVVCEDKVCKPVGHPKYEIAAFGWSKIDWEKSTNGVRLFKLSHFQL